MSALCLLLLSQPFRAHQRTKWIRLQPTLRILKHHGWSAGATQTVDRKQRIYRICQKYDILIMEDDPYYYLQYTPGQLPQGLQNLGASYLRMDTDCRVIRFDSFSKVCNPFSPASEHF